MLDENGGTLRSVAWSELMPWLSIFRTFRLAVTVRVLVFGAVAILLTSVLWGVLGLVFGTDSPSTAWLKPYAKCPWLAVTDDMVLDSPWLPTAKEVAGQPLASRLPFFGTWAQLSRPAWEGFGPKVTLGDLACLVLCGLGSLAIWAFFGAAISRIAAVQLACEERVGWGAALRFACSKWLSYLGAPLLPLLGVLLLAVPVCLLGLLLRAGPGVMLAALVWPVLLGAGLVMALLLLGLFFGWPLMWPTVSAEGTDAFDALSRSYAYVFQRPLHYLFYALVAGAFGALGWLLVQNFAAAVVGLTYWAAGWGSGVGRIDAISGAADPLEDLGYAGTVLIHFWAGCVKLLAVGFLYGYFFTAATAIYFLLRRDVDATEMDEVFLEADESELAYGVPTLATGEASAPEAPEELPEIEPDESNGAEPGPQTED